MHGNGMQGGEYMRHQALTPQAQTQHKFIVISSICAMLFSSKHACPKRLSCVVYNLVFHLL